MWKLLTNLHMLVNSKLHDMGKKPVKMSALITTILRHALLRTADGVLDEYTERGIQLLSDPLFVDCEHVPHATQFPQPSGSSPTSGTSGTTEVPDGKRSHTGARPAFFYKDYRRSKRTVPGASKVKP